MIDGSSGNLAEADFEKQFLTERVGAIDEVVGQKVQWEQDMVTYQGELTANQASLETGDDMATKQISAADQTWAYSYGVEEPVEGSNEGIARTSVNLEGMKGER